MRNIDTKVDNVGDELTAAEWNSTQDELENVVTSADITLDGGSGPDTDTNMLGKAMAIYAACGQYYRDSGSVNAYVLTNPLNTKSITSYKDGATVTFKANNANTGPSTINVAGIGLKNLTQYDGTALDASNVNTNDFVTAIYNASNDRFELKGIVDTQFASGTVMLFGGSTAPIGWTRKSDWRDYSMIIYRATASPSYGGSVNPIAVHYHTVPSHTHTFVHTHTMPHTHTGPNHTHTTAGHTLTIAEMPAHKHDVRDGTGGSDTNSITFGGGNFAGQDSSYTWRSSDTYTLIGSTGGGGAHSHGNTGAGGTGNTGAASVYTTISQSTSDTSYAGTGNTGTNTAPYYREVLAAVKD